ncbi:MAG: hypothetical protein E6Q88_07695 [Lysobacteraceae bacterium]|nr:MAG: hypothetical protein E6Q88_07695 [Xanthomonadaceae bacterium]
MEGKQVRTLLIVALCAWASNQAIAVDSPTTKRKPAPKSNRFEMVQDGKRMSAEDFDAWMKARGIRIAKGPQKAGKVQKKKKR